MLGFSPTGSAAAEGYSLTASIHSCPLSPWIVVFQRSWLLRIFGPFTFLRSQGHNRTHAPQQATKYLEAERHHFIVHEHSSGKHECGPPRLVHALPRSSQAVSDNSRSCDRR